MGIMIQEEIKSQIKILNKFVDTINCLTVTGDITEDDYFLIENRWKNLDFKLKEKLKLSKSIIDIQREAFEAGRNASEPYKLSDNCYKYETFSDYLSDI